MLDALVPDRPVFLINRDHHGAWVNSRALELAGVDANTPDPVDGRIERDHDGHPTGMLQEGAMALVSKLLPATTEADLLAGLLRAQALLHSLGITAWQDAIIGTKAGVGDVALAYAAATGTDRLTGRVVGALWWQRDKGLEQLDELLEARDRLSIKGFQATSVKIMQDGVAENHTAAMLSPYLRGCSCGAGGDHDGISFVDPVALRDYVTVLDHHGFQVHFHALGDRAVREALDAVEAARRPTPPPLPAAELPTGSPAYGCNRGPAVDRPATPAPPASQRIATRLEHPTPSVRRAESAPPAFAH